MADEEWTSSIVQKSAVAGGSGGGGGSKKKKGKGKKNKTNNALVVAPSQTLSTTSNGSSTLATKSTTQPKAASAQASMEKRNNTREFFSKMYTSGEKLSEERLESRAQYAANDGVWNAQSDLWLREAQLSAQGNFQQQIALAYKEFDKKHGTNSFVMSGSLKEQLDPFNVRCKNFPMKRNPANGKLEVPREVEEGYDIASHGKESEDYFEESIKQDRLNSRMKELDEKLEEVRLASQASTASGQDGSVIKNKRSYPAWYLSCKGTDDLDDEEGGEGGGGGGYVKPDANDKVAMELMKQDMAANGMQSTYMMNAEREKLRKASEERKNRIRTEKLARITRHTPWDKVAQRIYELHDLQVAPRDCCRRFALTYTTFEKQDNKSKQKQLNMQLKRGPPSSKGRGDAVLAIACLSGRSVSTAEVIINMGADVDNRSNSDGATPFLRACEGGNPHIAKLLIDKGCDRTAETRDGRNAVHIAGQFKWPDLVEVLLDEGAPKCSIPRCARCKLVLRLLDKKREERRKQKIAKGAMNANEKMVRTPEERKAAIDAAMAAFEQEFGTFEDEIEADAGLGGLRLE